jgi:hypothetical protein
LRPSAPSASARPVAGMLALLAAFLLATAADASAAGPTVISGNPTCAEVGASVGETWSELKVEPVKSGDYSDGTVSIHLDLNGPAQTISFTATPGVDAVIVKGGDNANAYVYSPDATSDTGLHAPDNPSSGEFYGPSHVSLCYGPDAPGTPGEPGTPGDPGDPGTPGTPGQPGQPALPAGQPALPAPPQGGVGGVQASLGVARLKGPSGCVSKAFTVKVTGQRIAKVAFSVDGRKVRTISAGQRFQLRINPKGMGFGVHKVAAKVTFAANSSPATVTRRVTFQRCARSAAVPKFTG